MNKYLRIILLILTIFISLISAYLLYDLLIKFNQINYFNTSEKLFLTTITFFNLISTIPSITFHLRVLFQIDSYKKTDLLDHDFEKNQVFISPFIKKGHLVMGVSISSLGFFVFHFTMKHANLDIAKLRFLGLS